jgi:Restriction endonuclease
MPKTGEDLQRLVEHLEKATAAIDADAGVEVESPKLVFDKDTGKLREHDVVLTFRRRHLTLTVALECRDRSRKVGVPEVEAFDAKCRKTGMHQGIIVSSRGFCRSALRKAAALDIGCLTLEEAARFDWCSAPGIELRRGEMLHVHTRVVTERPVGAGIQVFF